MKAYIIVEGGIVQDVYCDGDGLEVEILDLDEPDFATEAEVTEFDRLREEADEITNNPALSHVY